MCNTFISANVFISGASARAEKIAGTRQAAALRSLLTAANRDGRLPLKFYKPSAAVMRDPRPTALEN
ncbi:MAG: hypothetical protein ACJ74J_07060 [Blastocatellia bacterium]